MNPAQADALVVVPCLHMSPSLQPMVRLYAVYHLGMQGCYTAMWGVNGGDKVGRVGGRLLSIGDLIVYRLPSFIGL